MDDLEMSRAEAQSQVKRGSQTIDEYISDCSMMREDIVGSIEVIKSAEERAFRPVMESYKEKLAVLRSTSSEFGKSIGIVKEVVFNDVEQVGRRLVESMQVRLQDPEMSEDIPIIESQRHSSVYFSFDNQGTTSNRKS
jgi:hypothetical protein